MRIIPAWLLKKDERPGAELRSALSAALLRDGHSPSPLFDEAWYRRRYPDAGHAVESGDAASGLDHYLSFGAALGYLPCPYFDSDWYAAVNQDVSDGSAPLE